MERTRIGIDVANNFFHLVTVAWIAAAKCCGARH
jgi:hypothetical protein